MKKRILNLILAVCMICSMVPVQAFAVEDCSHHTEHTAGCGYAAPVVGSPCTHEHDDSCYSAETVCLHTAHDEGCGGVEDESLCTHECGAENDCITSVLNCAHVHDEACGYAEASEGTPCNFESETCADCATEAEAAVPMPLSTDTTTIYLKPGDYWPSGTYDYAVWNWYDGADGFWVEPTSQSPDGDGWVIFEIEAPNVIFVALTEGSTPDWSNKVYQTDDLEFDGSRAYYTLTTITGGEWSDRSTCDHSYESVVTTPASCTATGVRTYTCSLCGSSYTETIAKLEHTLDATGTCTACGATPGMVYASYTHLFPEDQFDCYAWAWPEGSGSRWVSPSSTQTVDGYTAFPVEDSDAYVIFLIVPQWAEPSWSNRVTQTQNIAIDGSTYETLHGPYTQGTLGAENKMQTYSADQPCAHSWSESTTAAGCTTDGRRIFDCNNCGASANIVLPATGHSEAPEELTVITPASCTTDGSGTYTCENCQETITVTIPVTGHNLDENGTCSTCGNSAAVECTYNGTVTYFDTLNEAYRRSGIGTYSLKLLADTTVSSMLTVAADHPLELDLNGYTLSVSGTRSAFHISGGDTTVTNGTIEILNGVSSVFEINDNKLTLTDVTFTKAENTTSQSFCVYNITGSCELTRVKIVGRIYALLWQASTKGGAVLNDCQTYDTSATEEDNMVYAASGSSLTVNGGKYQYLSVMGGVDGVGAALPEGYWYRYLADGTYAIEGAVTTRTLSGVEVVPIPLTPTLAETATAILGQPLTLESSYTANIDDFDPAELEVLWRYDEAYFTVDPETGALIPLTAGETTVTYTYSYKGYTVQVPVTVIIEQQYTVTFEMNGHGDAIDSQTVTENDTAAEPTAPEASGYIFGGWYTDESCTDGNEFAFTTPITADITLYAKWTVAHSHDDGTAYMEWTATSGNVTSGNYYLSGDITATGIITIPSGATVTLCLNGQTLDMGTDYYIANKGTLHVCDCGKGVITGENGVMGVTIENAGTLTVSGGTIQNTSAYSGGMGIHNLAGGIATVTGGTVRSDNNAGIGNKGTLTVSGGTIQSNSYYGIYNTGTLTVSGGNISSDSSYGIYNMKGNSVLYLSGSPTVSGGSADLRNYNGTIYGQSNDATPVAYSGDSLTVSVPLITSVGDIVIRNAAPDKFTLVNKACHVLAQGTGDNAPHLVVAANHTWDTLWTFDSTAHWHECTVDGCTIADNSQKGNYALHTGQGTSNEDGTHNVNCTVCAALLEENVSCVFDNDCDTDCNICGGTRTVTHPYENGICNICGAYEPALDSDGDGYYEITNAGNLWWFSQQVNNGYSNRSLNAELTADIDLAGTCGEGIGNWMSIGNWIPIGNKYSGHFNGQGFIISNLYMTGNNLYVGLFGYANGATIENVTVTGSVSSTAAMGDDYSMAAAGGIAGYLDGGTIRNCHVDMTVSGEMNMGGICGATNGNSLIENCTSRGSVVHPAVSNWSGQSLGGIVGNKNAGTVRGCTNYATISTLSPNSAYLGGITACNSDGTVENCTNFGDISTVDGASGAMAGVVRYNGGTVRNCSNHGNILGWHRAGVVLENSGPLENCYNVGTVSGVLPSDYVGSVVALNREDMGGVITNCYYLSDTETEDGGRTADQFASGQVTHELNGSVTADTNIWRQTIGTDGYPTFSGELVYHGETFICDGTSTGIFYHNQEPDTSVPPHSYGENGLCTVCRHSGTPAEDSDGDGYYEIDTPAKLWWFTQQVNGGNTAINAVLTADIDLGTTCGEEIGNWEPISTSYSGHFDGQGHTVSNLYISGNEKYAGLFGSVSGATIENISVSGSISVTGNADLAGGIAAQLQIGTIRNCHTDVTISSQYYAGGIVAQNGSGTVTGCTSRSDLNSTGMSALGGIVSDNRSGTVENCLNFGTLTANTYNSGAGGIVYYTGGTIRSCGNLGSVSGTYSSGVVYKNNNGSVTNCYNASGSSIVSDNYGSVATITNCYYLSDTETEDGGRTAEQFASGQVTYELNGSATADTNIWRQTIGTDTYPVFSGPLVYYGINYGCDGNPVDEVRYHNEAPNNATPPHTFDENGFCTVCGGYQPAELVEGVYQITNGGNLFWFAELVNGGTSDASALVTADIDLESREWTPISGYTGTFDGGGHSITNLLVSKVPASGSGYKTGFFSTILSPAVVKNFTISGAVNATTQGYSPNAMGGVVGASGEDGKANGGTVSGVTSLVTLNTTAGLTISHVGGVVGAMYGGTVTQCVFNGSINYCGATISEMGGIVGYGQAGTIQSCFNLADVSYAGHAGGILGYVNNANTHVRNCYNYGIISGKSNYTGAIIGRANNRCGTVEGNYYCSDNMAYGIGTGSGVTFDDTAAIGKTQEAFHSGEVTWLLNGESSDGIWKQTIGGNNLPGFSGGTVYLNTLYVCDGTSYTEYSNTQVTDATVPPHQFDEAGQCTVCNTPAVVSVTIEDTVTFYADFQKALNAAANGTEDTSATVKLLQNIEIINASDTDYTLYTWGSGVGILDLNGHTISHLSTFPGPGRYALQVTGGQLTVRDSVGGGSITSNDTTSDKKYGNNRPITVTGGTLILESGTLLCENGCGLRVENGTFLQTGGTIQSSENFALSLENSSATITGGTLAGFGTIYSVASTLEVTGGTFQGTDAGLLVQGGSVAISGGTFSCDALPDLTTAYGLLTLAETQHSITGGTWQGGFYAIAVINSGVGLLKLNTVMSEDYAFQKADGTFLNLTEGQKQITETVTVAPVPIRIAAQPTGFTTTRCKPLSLTITTDVAADSYVWYRIDESGDVEMATTATFQPDATAEGTFQYYCQATKDGYIVQSDTVTVQVDPCPHVDGVDSEYKCTVCGEQTVAMVTAGDSVSYYDNFTEAVTAAGAAGTATLTLLTDVTNAAEYTISNCHITLDLNGHTLAGETLYFNLVGGSFLLTDTSSEKTGTIRKTAELCVFSLEHTDFTMDAGTVTANGEFIFANQSNVLLESGTVTAPTAVRMMKSDDLITTVQVTDGMTIYYSGDCFQVDQYGGDGNTLTITGGTLSNTGEGKLLGSMYSTNAAVSGGTFEGLLQVENNENMALSQILAPGYCFRTSDGTCTVNATMTSLSGTVTVVPAPWLAIDEKNFPDANFRSYVSENCDSAEDTETPGYLTEEELLAVTEMSLNNKDIASLEGIQYFTALTTLRCNNNQLAALDVSKNTALTSLNCSYNAITELNVSRHTALTTLNCYNNQLTKLDVSNNTDLLYLNVQHNQLTKLDVSNNTALTSLDCQNNQLTSLDVSQNTALTQLYCRNNQLASLDVSACTALEWLYCGNNQLTSLNVSGCTALELLYCGDNQLPSLDVSTNTALTRLACYKNQLTNLDVSKNTALDDLQCEGNGSMTALTLAGAVSLTNVSCYDNGLTTLDVSQNPALYSLDCSGNALTELDVSQNGNLVNLYCNGNRLTALDVSSNAELGVLRCENNHLTALDLTQNTALAYFVGSGQTTQITLNADGTADLSALGDTTKMTLSSGGTMENGIVTPDAGATEISYTYSTGSEKGDLEVTASLLAAGTVSVDITWGAMEFTYDSGTWNPDTLTYEGGGWTANTEDGNAITVTNSGTEAVTVSVSYTQAADYTVISGSFTETTAALAAGEEKKFWLLLSGKPESELSGTALGTVTVTIGGE